jgi:general secretion pathway protein E
MRSATKITSLNAAQVLRAEGLITAEQLEEVQREAQASGERVADIVLARGIATEYDLAKALVHQLSLPFLSPKMYDVPKEALAVLPPAVLQQHRILPIDLVGDVLVVATYTDLDAQAMADMESDTGKKIACVVSLRTELEQVLNEKFPRQDLGKEVASRLDQLFGQ